ncbi:hypothetical protein F3Y22_tig00112249pilonHSYRG00362 [Hibiscus syriacus]|uniref:Disease resistance protein Roq1-like winged-helix domain-containing protein n=1 Tax=Hibiscus syriacus TaxID=106335 RepID=A0A6A2YCI7_HIBSY|nr:hypothetical protein F3Y22_tig00112249pilonHSYRG00362 [Hibiscus syriacus]
MICDKSNENFDSQEDADIEETHDGSATETRFRYISFGDAIKIIVTSRDRQVLKNGEADTIHEVKQLNENDSLQLFSTFAFKLLNLTSNVQDLSNMFFWYAQGSPLALKVLGSKLCTKSRKEWESEVDKLKDYAKPKISQILMSWMSKSRIYFLALACVLKGESKKEYKGAMCGISDLLDKCLNEVDSNGVICMHDMLEEMGKDIVRRESKDPGERSRLWSLKDMIQVLKYNKLGLSDCKSLVEIPNLSGAINLQILCCNGCGSLVELPSLNQLVSLESLDLSYCKNLRKIPNPFGAINLKSLKCNYCISLVELPCLNHLASLKGLGLEECHNLKKFPDLPNNFSELDLRYTEIEQVSDSIQHLIGLRKLSLSHSRVENVSSNISKLESLNVLELEECERLKTLRASTISAVLECKLLHIIGERYDVPANEFEHRSIDPRLNLDIAPNACSGSRFLAFALCFFALPLIEDSDVGFICKYQLTAASGEKFMRESRVSWRWDRDYEGHMFIVFNKDMIIRDNDYGKASFEFYIEDQLGRQYTPVVWYVHVFYVDAESYSLSDVMSCDTRSRFRYWR